MENNEIKIINIQITATILFMFSLFISLIITYNAKLKLQNSKILNNNIENYLLVFNRIFVVFLSLIFLFSNLQNKKLAKEKEPNKSLDSFNLQIEASQLITLAAIIALYATVNNYSSNAISNVENPNL